MKPIMDEQDEIDMLKAIIKTKSEAILRLKRDAATLLDKVDYAGALRALKEREALRKALSETN